jgi:hypothetical protein
VITDAADAAAAVLLRRAPLFALHAYSSDAPYAPHDAAPHAPATKPPAEAERAVAAGLLRGALAGLVGRAERVCLFRPGPARARSATRDPVRPAAGEGSDGSGPDGGWQCERLAMAVRRAHAAFPRHVSVPLDHDLLYHVH